MTFNLHAAAREVFDTVDSPDRDVLAEALYRAVPVDLHGEVLRGLLRGYVTTALAGQRREVEPEPLTLVGGRTAPGKGRSAQHRTAAIAGVLGERVHAADGTPIWLRDATISDLEALAVASDKQATGHRRTALKYRALARAIDAAGVKTVYELGSSNADTIWNAA